jgi:hypothetical protein
LVAAPSCDSENQIRRIGDTDGGAVSADEDVTPAAAERGRERSSSSGPLGRLLVPRPESDLAENTLMADLAET